MTDHITGKPILGRPTLTVNPPPAGSSPTSLPPVGTHHELSVKEETLAGGAVVTNNKE